MIYVYFFIKCVVKLSENSVRFEKSYGNCFLDGPNSVRFYLTVGDMACMEMSYVMRKPVYALYAKNKD